MRQQLHPEDVRVLALTAPGPCLAPPAPAEEATAPADVVAAPASAPASTPPVLHQRPWPVPWPLRANPPSACRSGSFDERQTMVLRRGGGGCPKAAGCWRPPSYPERWMVYMGRFLTRMWWTKRAELRALACLYDRPGAAWEHGLSLGRFSSEERAQAALKDLVRQGIRTARVVQERTESKVHTLRLPAVDRALQSQLPACAGRWRARHCRVTDAAISVFTSPLRARTGGSRC